MLCSGPGELVVPVLPGANGGFATLFLTAAAMMTMRPVLNPCGALKAGFWSLTLEPFLDNLRYSSLPASHFKQAQLMWWSFSFIAETESDMINDAVPQQLFAHRLSL